MIIVNQKKIHIFIIILLLSCTLFLPYASLESGCVVKRGQIHGIERIINFNDNCQSSDAATRVRPLAGLIISTIIVVRIVQSVSPLKPLKGFCEINRMPKFRFQTARSRIPSK